MAKRALVIGAKVAPLRGPEDDAAMMQAMLEGRGFEVDVRIADRATRAGILAGYDRLIAASQPGDAAVIYYSGHGSYGQVLREDSRSWQAIVPVDYPDSTDCDWRGVTAWELSIKQAELTAKTRNVTVILDACSASQMSRRDQPAPEPGVEVRTLPHPVAGFGAHLALLRERYGAAFEAVDPVSNRDAVRLVACGQGETAFEIPVTSDRTHGVFTTALVEILTELGDVEVSWVALAAAVRARVRRRRPTQFPAIEGPARRRLFSLVEEDETGRLGLDSVADRLRLAGGVITGVALDDAYGIMPMGATAYDAGAALGTVRVDEVHALTSFAARTAEGPTFPADAVAFPITRTAVQCVDGRGLRE
ncbi:MAG: caspase family protein, partial [Myxococcales bacterium]|nr:caspase family protein [Myxococcales bacterium]